MKKVALYGVVATVMLTGGTLAVTQQAMAQVPGPVDFRCGFDGFPRHVNKIMFQLKEHLASACDLPANTELEIFWGVSKDEPYDIQDVKKNVKDRVTHTQQLQSCYDAFEGEDGHFPFNRGWRDKVKIIDVEYAILCWAEAITTQ